MVSKEEIIKIAKLSRLEISQIEAEEYANQLSKALIYFEQISKVDTKEVEPLVTPTKIELFMREDEISRELTSEELLNNVPQRTGNLITVPPVV